MTPTARSIAHLRKLGWSVCSVEKWIPQTRQRKDAFGFGDLLACHVSNQTIALIQVTSTGNMSARREKMRGIAEVGLWLASGGVILLHGWAKRGNAGERKLWTLKEEAIDFTNTQPKEADEP